jgi:hypothetical protein
MPSSTPAMADCSCPTRIPYDLEAPERKEAVYDVVARVEQVDAEERDRRLAEWAKGNV